MKYRKILSSLIAAAMSLAVLPAYGTAAVTDGEKITLTSEMLSGSPSWNNQNGYENAFDGSEDTFFDGLQNGWCQVDLGAEYDISGIRFHPRKGKKADQPAEYVERMRGGVFSGSLDGSDWTELYAVPDSIYTNDTDTSTLCWHDIEVSGKYRYIKYENTVNAANIAEIELYGTYSGESGPTPTPVPTATPDPAMKDFTLIDRTGWSVETNSQQSSSGGNSAPMVLDGNKSTIWHSSWTNASNYDPETNPVYITVNMGKTQTVSGIKYTPRTKDSTAGSINGVITAYEVYASSDNLDWKKIGEGNMGYKADDAENAEKDIIFEPADCQYVKLVVKDNLDNGGAYVGSCAELNLYEYTGEADEHPILDEKAKLDTVISELNSLETTHEMKQLLTDKAEELKISGSIDGIEGFITTSSYLIDALGWIDEGIDDIYIGRIMTMLAESKLSAVSLSDAQSELSGFYTLGSEAKAIYADKWQDEFTMSAEEEQQPLYERLKNAIARARARIDSGDGNDYKMLKELVSYASGKYAYTGYEDPFGMSAERCEAIVNNINFTLSNLEKIDSGELSNEMTVIRSGEIWLDTLGSKISAHGGQILKQGDTYYWYGEDNKIAYDLTTGVSCYSSKDLKNWTYEGIVFKAFDDGTEAQQFTKEFLTDTLNGTKGRIERPKVIYNEKNDNYVMWMHLEKDGGYGLSVAGVATSDSPTGPFVWQWYGRPVADTFVQTKEGLFQAYRDMNLFVDDDNTAYVFYSSENNRTMYAVRLNDDYTWIDDEGLKISGSTEADITEGAVIVPDMTELTTADYTYGKTSFTRYQLASGGAMQLSVKKNADGSNAVDENGNRIYVSERNDGRIAIPTYPETGRWARVGQNIGEGNDAEGMTETIVNNNTAGSREAPAPIKIDGKYYMVTSALSGWKANPSLTQVSDSILGEWISTGNPITGDGPVNNGQWSQNAERNTSFNSQSTCILQLPDGRYMYMGDRWKNGVYETSNANGTFPDVDVKASTYVWLPITFENDSTYGENTLKIRWHDEWSIADTDDAINITYDESSVSCSFSVTETAEQLTAYLALYDENDILIDVRSAGIDNGEASITVDRGSAYKAKAFVWTAEQQPAAPARSVTLD